MRSLTNFLMLAGVIVSFTVQSKEQPFKYDDPKFLQKSCLEVVAIFNKKDQPGTYAALHTSMAEAMRAGYCIGVVQQYMQQTQNCYSRRYKNGDWFAMAKSIANVSIGEEQFKRTQVSQLLEDVYCNG
ncbi:hypothetical protein ORJ00_07710 [Rheinheimera baltica]|uniref:hypothetical protein n=1 Tax=Rheinheimera baltica TaxID=67576 RepID=UPI00273EC28E|nr:hypothetical protein [Rheinheimera baltica]MDP5142621.1 hypothetical protein [Rheinheimera baltica]